MPCRHGILTADRSMTRLSKMPTKSSILWASSNPQRRLSKSLQTHRYGVSCVASLPAACVGRHPLRQFGYLRGGMDEHPGAPRKSAHDTRDRPTIKNIDARRGICNVPYHEPSMVAEISGPGAGMVCHFGPDGAFVRPAPGPVSF